MSSTLSDGTRELYLTHVRAHLVPWFGSLERVTSAELANYFRARLKKVKRETVKKERTTLRSMLHWCLEQGVIGEMPEFPELPRGAVGTAYSVRRRGKPTELSPEESRSIIAVLPQWSTPRGGREAFPVRPRFEVAYETGLRPATLNGLSVPEHFSKGNDVLIITDEIDKARFGRELPLTEVARAALDSVAPERGLIFGEHDYRYQLSKAAKKALEPAKARTFAAYDLRHSRATELVEKGNLVGAAYLLGHKQLTTTNRYARPTLRAARGILSVLDGSPASDSDELAGKGNQGTMMQLCEEGESNPHGCYPTSTSKHRDGSVGLNADPVVGLIREAEAILRLAESGGSVDLERLHSFARAALDASDLGRLALAVLEGGHLAGTRAVELASWVLDLECQVDCCDDDAGSSPVGGGQR